MGAMARDPEEVAATQRALGELLAAFRQAADLTQADVARVAICDRTMVAHVEKSRSRWRAPSPLAEGDELEALELARRVCTSDVGDETLTRLELVVDELATAYPKTPPAALLQRIRQHLGYVNHLLNAHKTLSEHRRLLVIGGWLSLLGATLHTDLTQHKAAAARLKTAASLARHAEHDEIRAWCLETEAWRVLTEGHYPHAIELSRAAHAIAPAGSSAAIQATAQVGILGDVRE
jgi:transcriptional regulator with XRE-family HTH domain